MLNWQPQLAQEQEFYHGKFSLFPLPRKSNKKKKGKKKIFVVQNDQKRDEKGLTKSMDFPMFHMTATILFVLQKTRHQIFF